MTMLQAPTGDQPVSQLDGAVVEQLREIWQETLDVADLQLDDELPDLGGQSILIIKMAVQIEQILGVQLPLEVFLEVATLRGIAEVVTEARRGEARP